MTPNQQEEMEKEFEKYNDRCDNESGSFLLHQLEGIRRMAFRKSWTLQQEKVEKLEKENKRLNKFCEEFVYGEENPQYYKTMDEQIESLKSDLEWCFSKFRQMLPRMSESYGVGVEEGIREIRQRHYLDKSEEV